MALEFLALVAQGIIDPPAGESKFVSYRAAVNFPWRVVGHDLAQMTAVKMIARRVAKLYPRQRRKTRDANEKK